MLTEGVQVSALVDTGSQTTIIAHTVLHEIGRHLREQGKPLPHSPSVARMAERATRS